MRKWTWTASVLVGVMMVGVRVWAYDGTGLDVEVTGIVGVYSDPGHVIAYSDGEVRQEFNLCFAARLVGGQLSVSDESTEVRWVAPLAIEQLPMHESIRLRIKHFLEHGPAPAIA